MLISYLDRIKYEIWYNTGLKINTGLAAWPSSATSGLKGNGMSNKFYITDWMSESGRYAIITTAFQEPVTKQLAAESFVFSLDGEPIFDSSLLTYEFDTATEKPNDVDEAYMLKEALGHAMEVIGLQKTKNLDIEQKLPQVQEYDLRYVILDELSKKYEDKLKEMSQRSGAEDLRQLISTYFNIAGQIEPL